MATLTEEQLTQLLSDPDLAGIPPEQIRQGLETLGQDTDRGALSRVWQAVKGGAIEGAGGALGFAGMAADFAGTPLMGGDRAAAMQTLGGILERRGEPLRMGALEGAEGLEYAATRAAGWAGLWSDAIVGAGVGTMARKALRNRAITQGVDRVRAGLVGDAAKTLDEVIEETAPTLSLAKPLDDAVNASKAADGNVKLLINNFRSFGKALAHQMFYRTESAGISAVRREKLIKKVVSDKALREDMVFYIQGRVTGKGNPFRSLTDTFDDVAARIAAHEDGDLAIQVADHYAKNMDESLKALNEVRTQIGDDVLDPLDGYVHQAWDMGQEGTKRSRKLSTLAPSEKRRYIESYWDGIVEEGLTPRTTDLAEIWHVHEKSLGKAMAIKKLFRDIGEFSHQTMDNGMMAVGRVADDAPVPDGYKVVSNRILDEAVAPTSLPEGQASLFGGAEGVGFGTSKGTKLIMHEELYRPLKHLLKPKTPQSEWERGAHEFVSLLKRFNFSFSLFHAYSLSESAINALGPIRGPLMAARMIGKGGAIPLPKRWIDDIPGGAKALDDLLKPSLTKDNEARALLGGVKIGAPKSDLMRDAWEEAVGRASEVPVLGKALVKPYAAVQRAFDTALWDRFHHPMKVEVFNRLVDDMTSLKQGTGFLQNVRPFKKALGKRLQNVSDDEISQRVGAFVNDEFGGQAWELMVPKIADKMTDPDGKFMKIARSVFLSPDWNVSSIRAGTALGSILKDPVRGTLGIRHWVNAVAGSYVYANVANYAFTKFHTGKGKFLWENEPGKDFWYIDSGVKEKGGRKVYLRWGKQYQEMKELFGGDPPIVGFAGRKMMPVLQAGLSPWSRGNFPTQLAQMHEQAKREGRELGWWGNVRGFSEDMLDAALPFQASSLRRMDTGPGTGIALAMAPFPKSKGMSPYKAETMLAEAFRDGDYEEVSAIQGALRENGVSSKKIGSLTRAARKKAARYK